MKVLIAGGGTAGHVIPALAVAAALRERGAEVTFVGSADGQEAVLVPAAGYAFEAVRAISAQTRLSLRTLRAVAVAIRGARALRPLARRADVVLGVGGSASAPAILAARWVRRPIVLVEQNSVPGLVNRIAARWASTVATTFEATAARLPQARRTVRTGNPIRAEIAGVAQMRDELAAQARAAFGLEPGRFTVLVVGGSQGALQIDRAVAGALQLLGDRGDLQLLISTGRAHEAVVADAVDPGARLLVHVRPFIDRMDLALAVADLVVSRAGAGIAELAACGVPSVLVPYPYATEDHQAENARELTAAGAAVSITDAGCTPQALAACILGLMDDPERRREMTQAALAWARPDAAGRVADLIGEAAA